MRKFLLGLLVFAGGAACQADQYLYWTIDSDQITLKDSSGTVSPAGTGNYRAYIRQYYGTDEAAKQLLASQRTAPNQRLQLYEEGQVGGVSFGDYVDFNVGNGEHDEVSVFAKLVQDQAVSSFAVELFYDGGSGYEWYGRAAFAYNDSMSQYFATGGMSEPANPYSVNSYDEVPEPTSGVLLLVGLAGLALRRQKVQRG